MCFLRLPSFAETLSCSVHFSILFHNLTHCVIISLFALCHQYLFHSNSFVISHDQPIPECPFNESNWQDVKRKIKERFEQTLFF
jgi:hypothetical protein